MAMVEALVGAGTVLTAGQVDSLHRAGGRLLVECLIPAIWTAVDPLVPRQFTATPWGFAV